MLIFVVADDERLAASLTARLQQRGHSTLCFTGKDFDCAAIDSQFDEDKNPLLIYVPNTGARTTADYQSAAELGQVLAAYCERRQLPLFMLVAGDAFSDKPEQFFTEQDPLSNDGIARLEAIAYQAEKHIILRSGPLFGDTDLDFLTPLLRSFFTATELQLSSVRNFCPTNSDDVCRVISGIIDQLSVGAECWGTYHYSSSDVCSCYEFAEVTLSAVRQYRDVSGHDVVLVSSASVENVWIAQLFDCGKILANFGIHQRAWRSSIVNAVRKIIENENLVLEKVNGSE